MKTFILFFNQQKVFLFLLLLLVLIPFALLCIFTQSIPYIPYFFLLLIFFLKTMIFNENTLKSNLSAPSENELKTELKRQPSSSEIQQRIRKHIGFRDISQLFAVIYIILLGLFYSKF